MKYDKTKAFSAVNAEDVKIGSKGYFARTVEQLKMLVQEDEKNEWNYGILEKILPEDEWERFFGTYQSASDLFYLVEQPINKEEK